MSDRDLFWNETQDKNKSTNQPIDIESGEDRTITETSTGSMATHENEGNLDQVIYVSYRSHWSWSPSEIEAQAAADGNGTEHSSQSPLANTHQTVPSPNGGQQGTFLLRGLIGRAVEALKHWGIQIARMAVRLYKQNTPDHVNDVELMAQTIWYVHYPPGTPVLKRK
jgi:hypothetical protein